MTAILSLNTWASLNGFEQRFEFVREDGKLIAVRDKSLSSSFKISTYLQYIKNEILTEQQMMLDKSGEYESSIRDLFSDGNGIAQNQRREVNHVVNSMTALGNIDFEEVFNNPKFVEVMTQFEGKLKEAFFYIDPQLVAKPDNAKFFYKRNVTHKVVSWALNFAAKRLSTVPLLNTASYAITEIEKMIVKRRLYHQNMLLHYLELASEEELGLTKEEADSIFSSIYESRIAWYAFWESNSAVLNWDRFGSSKFYAGFRVGTNKLRSFRDQYTDVGERLNYAFQEVEFKGERVIINLVDSNNMVDSKPAVAFSFDNPKKIKRLRSVLTLARLGVSFVTLPAMIKDLVHNYIKSYYDSQQITEGALFAHFEYSLNEEGMNLIKKQYINPFDQL